MVGPWNDGQEVREATKYYYYPVCMSRSQLAAGFNASFWGSLSEQIRC